MSKPKDVLEDHGKLNRADLERSILTFLTKQTSAPYHRLHTEFDPYSMGTVGIVLYDMIESNWIHRIGSDRVEITDLGRTQLQKCLKG